MRVLFTGVTSFTGMWFAEKLIGDGHELVCAIRRSRENYSGLRAQRLNRLNGACSFAWNTPFGSDPFISLIAAHGPFDLLCHHAAEVGGYKEPSFDAIGATAANTRNLGVVLRNLQRAGCERVLLTGTVFESDEGAGTMPSRAFSPYGLSKTLTAQAIRFYAEQAGMAIGKFVIANPFGPLEEPRFTDYLMRCWRAGECANVKTPAYVRDNIPVSLLAHEYSRFAKQMRSSGFSKLTPSFYVETQGAFAHRFAREIGARLAIDTPLELARQTEFPEPAVRIGTDRPHVTEDTWSEEMFWDGLADYYGAAMAIPTRTKVEKPNWRNA